MNKAFEFDLSFELDEPDQEEYIAQKLALKLNIPVDDLPEFDIKKRAIDARHGHVRIIITVGSKEKAFSIQDLKEVSGEPIIIIGAGPAGLFCAYELTKLGIASMILERGKDVRARRVDLKGLNQHHVVNPDSNYCFGEGGAGTYSDGKLYTRAHKRGSIRDILETLVTHGAPVNILTDARPHIGSNLLPKVISSMRIALEKHGVIFKFNSKVSDILVDKQQAIGVRLSSGQEILGPKVVVATGHSARDIYEIMANIKSPLEAKPFAMGVRIEHPQELINKIQYGRFFNHKKLRAAPYRLAYTPTDGRGAFSFCMCPGGFIVPASTVFGELVVNGMSLSRRNSPFANSGLVVAISVADLELLGFSGPLGGLKLQSLVEQKAFLVSQNLTAPAQRALDFVNKRLSADLPKTSYQPGIISADLHEVLGASKLPIAERLKEALYIFNSKMPGYLTNEAVLVGVESRTSSPVRMVRDEKTLCSPTIANLYPAGEGAGYAGGIVSAAMDGVRVAKALAG
jgi:uncharacterized FAD-dependent dehydrogenase